MAGHYDKYNELSQIGPVIRQNGAVYITGYAEAKQVLGDSKRFVKNYQNTLPPEQRAHAYQRHDMYSLLYNNMLESDPPDHTRLRKLISKAFTNREVHRLEPRIQEIADQLIDQFEPLQKADLVDVYSFQLPIIVICELLGIPTKDRHLFREWSPAFFGIANSEVNYVTAMQDFLAYIGRMIAERRSDPKDDLISGLVHAEEEGDRLTEQELYAMLALLIVAGHETTVSLITTAVAHLLQHPDQLRQLKDNPDLADGAIDEFMRFEGAIEMATQRYAAEDVQIGDLLVRRGTSIIVILAAANRDPAAFENPITLDITRDARQQLGFGYGIHYCVGAPLARLEAKIALNTLFQRLPTLRLDINPDWLEYTQSAVVTSITKLPVRW